MFCQHADRCNRRESFFPRLQFVVSGLQVLNHVSSIHAADDGVRGNSGIAAHYYLDFWQRSAEDIMGDASNLSRTRKTICRNRTKLHG